MNINNTPSFPVNMPLSSTAEAVSNQQASNSGAEALTFTPSASNSALPALAGNNSSLSELLSNVLKNLKALLANGDAPAQSMDITSGSSYADTLAAQSFEVSNMSSAAGTAANPVPKFTEREVDGETVRSYRSIPHVVNNNRIRNDDGELVTDELSGHFLEGSNNETERFRVARGQPKQSNGLDPRAEARFDVQVSSTGSHDYEFNGQYNIISAKETTIFQMLNTDTSIPVNTGARQPGDPIVDRHHPVLFLEAETKTVDGERMVEVVERETGRLIYEGPSEFRLKVETNGRNATITAHPEGKAHEATVTGPIFFDRDPETAGRQVGTHSTVRYGAYHHDNDGSRGAPSNSTANVLVTNARLERTEA